ncbi:MAG TPA: inositol monophosphatase family protein [Solirubrobacteraceae bacterium]
MSAAILQHDWLGACRASAQALERILSGSRAGTERTVETGNRGEGGDQTLVIDADAEEAVFVELARLHDAGARFTAVSEERGSVDFGGDGVIVLVDPIDGSLNAKRGLHSHAISIAVADGPTMADVLFAYVYDYGSREEWRALRGEGALLNDAPLDDPAPERRTKDGRLEIVCIESAAPRWLARASDGLVEHVHRVRALGSVAISLCQVAPPRVDGMCSLTPSRAVDGAAAQLIVREAGGLVAYPGFDDPLAAPLDLYPHSPVVAARTPDGLARLIEIVG